MTYDVYGVGNSLVDIQARVSDEVLATLGFGKGLMTLVDDATQRRVLAALDGAAISQSAGGSAANTLIALADFGGKSAYAAKVGDDALGRFCLQDMREIGVTIEVPVAAGDTGTSVILITDDAQRTMLTHLGVSATLGPDDVSEAAIRNAKYVYVEGYLFSGEPTRSAALRTIELAKQYGVKVAFTVSDPFLIAQHRDEFWRLIEGPVDLLFCNLEEARSLTGRHDPIECAVEIHKHADNVALTLGADGSILMHQGRVLPIEGAPAKAIDTTGAGDMYAGALLYGITNGLAWNEAGHLASQAAARIVSQLGARLKNKFTRAEIAALQSR
ncbi:MAG: adenosine kinase [Planctomycetaceae bacterium]|nr:adenosine kinase [Planctomycetaceae bacterium]